MPEKRPLNKMSLMAPGHVTAADSMLGDIVQMPSLPHRRYLPGWKGAVGLDLHLAFPSPMTLQKGVKRALGTTECLPHTAILLRLLGDGGGHSRSSIVTFYVLLAVWVQLSFVMHLLCALFTYAIQVNSGAQEALECP